MDGQWRGRRREDRTGSNRLPRRAAGRDRVRQALQDQRAAGVGPRGHSPAEGPAGVRERRGTARARRRGGRTARVGRARFALAGRELPHHSGAHRRRSRSCITSNESCRRCRRTSTAWPARQVARALGRFVAELHDAGVAHPDPHPGNLLVELPPIAHPTSRSSTCTPSASVIRSPGARVATTSSCSTAGSSSGRAAPTGPGSGMPIAVPAPRSRRRPREELRDGAKELERDTRRLEPPVLGRPRIALPRNEPLLPQDPPRGVSRVRRPRPRRRLPAATARRPRRGARPDRHESSRTREPRRSPCLMMPTPNGPAPVVLKRVNVRSRIEPLKNLLRPSHVLRSWVYGHALRDRWLPTPRPLAVFHRYRGGLPGRRLSADGTGARPDSPGRGDQTGRDSSSPGLLRAMHDRGVSHRDLKSANVILARGAEPILIDLVGVRTRVDSAERPATREGTGPAEREFPRCRRGHDRPTGSGSLRAYLSPRARESTGGLEKLVEDGIPGDRREGGEESPQTVERSDEPSEPANCEEQTRP